MDIVERLRVRAEENYEMCNDIHLPLIEAADEIKRLRKALERISNVQPIRGNEGSTNIISLAKALLRIDRIARDALKEKE